ncbi:MAG: 4Fe-4S dicluster domain-containing protein, partial [Desulfatibacillaceae bacterium]|nr:4Fe-4S dicluster domain-containing protein [Desulfatibacillaceae bacterium]
QLRILKQSFTRWAMHMLIFYGFMYLLVFHALAIYFANPGEAYLNPWLFLRNVAGVMVLVGLCIAFARRFIIKVPRLKTNGQDYYALGLVALIILSGLVLEGSKMTSQRVFMDMVENWAGLSPEYDEIEVQGLEAYWSKYYGLKVPGLKAPFDEEMLTEGLHANETYCASCHVSNKWAPAGYVTAKILSPIAGPLDRANAPHILYWIHVLACLLGLAYLPFSKMLHIFSTPASLVANAVMGDESKPANLATKQLLELEACTHCGTCSLTCSAMMGYYATGNPLILPAEKMQFLKKFAWGRKLSQQEMDAITEGMLVCTNCDRCTVVCPSGIELKRLWLSVREDVIQKGAGKANLLSPLSWFRGLNSDKLSADAYGEPVQKAQADLAGRFDELMAQDAVVELGSQSAKTLDPTFASCFGCQTCTTVCPVAGNYEDPGKRLGLVPHQIMLCLAMGQDEMASGAAMIWECVTCYQCQENCPQKVDVADVLYSLKNLAAKNLEQKKGGKKAA